MSIEGLKEQARRHEQREEWTQALELYRRAIERLAEEEQPDIGLYNRVGDLCVRAGDLEQAVEHYEQAVDLYNEAELPNNAIAVCKKIIRNMPSRNTVYLRMGRIRAEQAFLTDARQNFLTYVERVQAAGEIDEALRALMEFADLSPNDVEVRLAVAQQLEQHERKEEAIDQLKSAHITLMTQRDAEQAATIEEKIRELDPDADLASVSADASTGFETTSPDDDAGIGGEFGEIVLGEGAEKEDEEEVEVTLDAGLEGFAISAETDDEESAPLPLLDQEEEEGAPAFSLGGDKEEPSFGLDAEETTEEEAAPLPTFGAEEDEEEEAAPLPTFGAEEDTERLEAAATPVEDSESGPLTAEAFGESDRGEREAEEYVAPGEEMGEVEIDELALEGSAATAAREEAIEEAAFEARTDELSEAKATDIEALISVGSLDDAEKLLRDRMAQEPEEVSLRQRLVEVAYRRNDQGALADAYLELADVLQRTDSEDQAKSVYQQVLQMDPGQRSSAGCSDRGEGRTRAFPARSCGVFGRLRGPRFAHSRRGGAGEDDPLQGRLRRAERRRVC